MRGAILAGVSVVFAMGFGTTTSAAASAVAAMPERSPSSEEDIVTGQPKAIGRIISKEKVTQRTQQAREKSSPRYLTSGVYQGTLRV